MAHAKEIVYAQLSVSNIALPRTPAGFGVIVEQILKLS